MSWPSRNMRELDELENVLDAGGFLEATCECGGEPVGTCDGCGDLVCDEHLRGGSESHPSLCTRCLYPTGDE